MRTTIAGALLGAGLAVSMMPGSAQASCWYISEDLPCVQPPCFADELNKVDEKLGDHLTEFECMT